MAQIDLNQFSRFFTIILDNFYKCEGLNLFFLLYRLSIIRAERQGDIKNINNLKILRLKKKRWLNNSPKYTLEKLHIQKIT